MHAVLITPLSPGQPDLRTEVEIIVADVSEAESLAIMCKQAVVVLNCVGPVSIQQYKYTTFRNPHR